MPTYIGTISKRILREYYDKYGDTNYDIMFVKRHLVNIISAYSIEGLSVDDYKLNKCQVYGLRLNIKHNDDIIFMFCINTGHIYYSKSCGDYIL